MKSTVGFDVSTIYGLHEIVETSNCIECCRFFQSYGFLEYTADHGVSSVYDELFSFENLISRGTENQWHSFVSC